MAVIYVDADACPVTRKAEQIARRYHFPMCIVCDTNHVFLKDYADIITVDAGRDAVDLVIANRCQKGDIVITQDYGVAAMVLAKGGRVLHQNGQEYTSENIDGLLFYRHESAKMRRATEKHHLKGPKKRTAEDDAAFCEAFETLLKEYTT